MCRVRTIDVGVLPVAAVIAENGSSAWITNFGGPKPARRAGSPHSHSANASSVAWSPASRVRNKPISRSSTEAMGLLTTQSYQVSSLRLNTGGLWRSRMRSNSLTSATSA